MLIIFAKQYIINYYGSFMLYFLDFGWRLLSVRRFAVSFLNLVAHFDRKDFKRLRVEKWSEKNLFCLYLSVGSG